jgi:cytochrome c oxidase subunit II
MPLQTRLLSACSNTWGSPCGVTTQDHWARELWRISYYFAIPIAAIVVLLIAYALIRYRERKPGTPGADRKPAQFQYHIPIEAAYTIFPFIVVVVLFGFLFTAENHEDKVSKQPAVKITVDGFQWGWRFVYPNQHSQLGTGDYNDINNNQGLPVLVMPADETVQLRVVSLDVVHTFYVKEFLFNRDLIPGIDNVFDIDVTKTGVYPGQCNNICGEYHAYMRFLVDVMTPAQYNTWYSDQPACSITTAGVAGGPQPAKCNSQIAGLNAAS